MALMLCHKDICFGTNEDVSTNAVTSLYHQVKISESISQRLVRLLLYLHIVRPRHEGWSQFLRSVSKKEAQKIPASDRINFAIEQSPSSAQGTGICHGEGEPSIMTIDWSGIIISGHSQVKLALFPLFHPPHMHKTLFLILI